MGLGTKHRRLHGNRPAVLPAHPMHNGPAAQQHQHAVYYGNTTNTTNTQHHPHGHHATHNGHLYDHSGKAVNPYAAFSAQSFATTAALLPLAGFVGGRKVLPPTAAARLVIAVLVVISLLVVKYAVLNDRTFNVHLLVVPAYLLFTQVSGADDLGALQTTFLVEQIIVLAPLLSLGSIVGPQNSSYISYFLLLLAARSWCQRGRRGVTSSSLSSVRRESGGAANGAASPQASLPDGASSASAAPHTAQASAHHNHAVYDPVVRLPTGYVQHTVHGLPQPLPSGSSSSATAFGLDNRPITYATPPRRSVWMHILEISFLALTCIPSTYDADFFPGLGSASSSSSSSSSAAASASGGLQWGRGGQNIFRVHDSLMYRNPSLWQGLAYYTASFCAVLLMRDTQVLLSLRVPVVSHASLTIQRIAASAQSRSTTHVAWQVSALNLKLGLPATLFFGVLICDARDRTILLESLLFVAGSFGPGYALWDTGITQDLLTGRFRVATPSPVTNGILFGYLLLLVLGNALIYYFVPHYLLPVLGGIAWALLATDTLLRKLQEWPLKLCNPFALLALFMAGLTSLTWVITEIRTSFGSLALTVMPGSGPYGLVSMAGARQPTWTLREEVGRTVMYSQNMLLALLVAHRLLRSLHTTLTDIFANFADGQQHAATHTPPPPPNAHKSHGEEDGAGLSALTALPEDSTNEGRHHHAPHANGDATDDDTSASGGDGSDSGTDDNEQPRIDAERTRGRKDNTTRSSSGGVTPTNYSLVGTESGSMCLAGSGGKRGAKSSAPQKGKGVEEDPSPTAVSTPTSSSAQQGASESTSHANSEHEDRQRRIEREAKAAAAAAEKKRRDDEDRKKKIAEREAQLERERERRREIEKRAEEDRQRKAKMEADRKRAADELEKIRAVEARRQDDAAAAKRALERKLAEEKERAKKEERLRQDKAKKEQPTLVQIAHAVGARGVVLTPIVTGTKAAPTNLAQVSVVVGGTVAAGGRVRQPPKAPQAAGFEDTVAAAHVSYAAAAQVGSSATAAEAATSSVPTATPVTASPQPLSVPNAAAAVTAKTKEKEELPSLADLEKNAKDNKSAAPNLTNPVASSRPPVLSTDNFPSLAALQTPGKAHSDQKKAVEPAGEHAATAKPAQVPAVMPIATIDDDISDDARAGASATRPYHGRQASVASFTSVSTPLSPPSTPAALPTAGPLKSFSTRAGPASIDMDADAVERQRFSNAFAAALGPVTTTAGRSTGQTASATSTTRTATSTTARQAASDAQRAARHNAPSPNGRSFGRDGAAVPPPLPMPSGPSRTATGAAAGLSARSRMAPIAIGGDDSDVGSPTELHQQFDEIVVPTPSSQPTDGAHAVCQHSFSAPSSQHSPQRDAPGAAAFSAMSFSDSDLAPQPHGSDAASLPGGPLSLFGPPAPVQAHSGFPRPQETQHTQHGDGSGLSQNTLLNIHRVLLGHADDDAAAELAEQPFDFSSIKFGNDANQRGGQAARHDFSAMPHTADPQRHDGGGAPKTTTATSSFTVTQSDERPKSGPRVSEREGLREPSMADTLPDNLGEDLWRYLDESDLLEGAESTSADPWTAGTRPTDQPVWAGAAASPHRQATMSSHQNAARPGGDQRRAHAGHDRRRGGQRQGSPSANPHGPGAPVIYIPTNLVDASAHQHQHHNGYGPPVYYVDGNHVYMPPTHDGDHSYY